MSRLENSRLKSMEAMRAELVRRLQARLPEIEKAVFAQVCRLAGPIGMEDSAYLVGLEAAVGAAIGYAITRIERDDGWAPPLPAASVSQARRAAREGVGLDTVLRRYTAGSNLLDEFIVAEAGDLSSELLRQVVAERGPQIDEMMAAVAAEYHSELELVGRSASQRRAERVSQLLDGNGLASPADMGYDLEAWHLGMIIVGENAKLTARALAERLGCQLLELQREPGTVWAWLGGPRKAAFARLEQLLGDGARPDVSVAVGEPRHGLDGWRLTHREAQLALQVLLQEPKPLVRGRDVILLAGVMRDDTLVRALLDTYLGPLEGDGSSGKVLLETLRAYFAASGNAAAAAIRLGVTRHTVQRRIRSVETKLGRLLHTCQAELEVALRVDELKRRGRTRQK